MVGEAAEEIRAWPEMKPQEVTPTRATSPPKRDRRRSPKKPSKAPKAAGAEEAALNKWAQEEAANSVIDTMYAKAADAVEEKVPPAAQSVDTTGTARAVKELPDLKVARAEAVTLDDVSAKAEAVVVAAMKVASKVDWQGVGQAAASTFQGFANASAGSLPTVSSALVKAAKTGRAQELGLKSLAVLEMGVERVKSAVEAQATKRMVAQLTPEQTQTLLLKKLQDGLPLTTADLRAAMATPKSAQKQKRPAAKSSVPMKRRTRQAQPRAKK